MADTLNQTNIVVSNRKRSSGFDEWNNHDDSFFATKKQSKFLIWEDPAAVLANARHEFDKHGGINMSIEASPTFTVMELETMRRMFGGELAPFPNIFCSLAFLLIILIDSREEMKTHLTYWEREKNTREREATIKPQPWTPSFFFPNG